MAEQVRNLVIGATLQPHLTNAVHYRCNAAMDSVTLLAGSQVPSEQIAVMWNDVRHLTLQWVWHSTVRLLNVDGPARAERQGVWSARPFLGDGGLNVRYHDRVAIFLTFSISARRLVITADEIVVMAARRFPPPWSTARGDSQSPKSVISRTRFSFGFFQFPVVPHASKNWGKCEDDQPDNAQAENNSEE
jgi:hypothetical protein